MTDVAGKRVLVTGGAGGLGLAIARRFAAEGASLVLTDIEEGRLSTVRDELRAEGIDCMTQVMDVTDLHGIEAARERIHDMAGRIEVIVNNAGVVHGGPFLDVPLERHLLTYRVNILGLVAVTHAFLLDLVAAGSGHIVNIASASGFIGLPFGSSYASSKWAVIGFSESIRLEMKKGGHDGVGVTTVCPSYIDTGMFEGVEPPLLTRFLTAEEVAEKTLEGVLEDRAFVLEPWLVKLTPFLAHALPRRMSDLLSDLFGASSGMRSWRGHGT